MRPPCCMICMEPGGTEGPPCGFWHESVGFHAACLERLADSGSTQCPHCGVCIPATALTRMNRMLKRWLTTKPCGNDSSRPWNHRPLFLRVQSGMMYGAREAQVLCSAIGVVVSCLLLVAAGGGGGRRDDDDAPPPPHKKEEGVVFVARYDHEAAEEGHSLSYRFWLYQGMHTIQVVLTRVAVLSARGGCRIECDGYEISASRRKRVSSALAR